MRKRAHVLLDKLHESLETAIRERAALERIEHDLRNMIDSLTAASTTHPSKGASAVDIPQVSLNEEPATPESFSHGGGDNIDLVAGLIRDARRPLHITEIAKGLSVIKGRPISRTTIEPGLNRHVGRVPLIRRKLFKSAPSTFSVPGLIAEHPTHPPDKKD